MRKFWSIYIVYEHMMALFEKEIGSKREVTYRKFSFYRLLEKNSSKTTRSSQLCIFHLPRFRSSIDRISSPIPIGSVTHTVDILN